MARYTQPELIEGWNFSAVYRRVQVIDAPPDVFHILPQYLTTSKALLDIGTGGGERLKTVSHLVDPACAIESDLSRVKEAARNLSYLATVVAGVSEKLPFRDSSFDVIVCRHAPFSAAEVWRVLKPGGIFLTQQIAEDDRQNLKELFGRGQGYDSEPGTLQDSMTVALESKGFEVKAEACTYTEVFPDMDTLIMLLGNTPIIPGFDVEQDEETLVQIESQFNEQSGFELIASRFLLIASKPRT